MTLGLEEYRLTTPVRVRFRDMDALGHVNNAVYLTYLEEARVEYLRRVLDMSRPSDYAIVVARVEIDYRSAATTQDELFVGTRVIRIGGASFEMDYRIVAGRGGRVVAQAKTVLVGYDHKEKKVSKLPADFIAKVRDFDGIA